MRRKNEAKHFLINFIAICISRTHRTVYEESRLAEIGEIGKNALLLIEKLHFVLCLKITELKLKMEIIPQKIYWI
jgi:hypothetical protein